MHLKAFVSSHPSGKLLLEVPEPNAKVDEESSMIGELRPPVGKGPDQVDARLQVKKQTRGEASINAIQTRISVMDAVRGLALVELHRGGKGIMPSLEGRVGNMNTRAPRVAR